MDDIRRAVRDDDFSSLRSEDLVGLVRVFYWRVPWNALLERCADQIERMIPGSLKRRLSSEDLADITQIGLMSALRAIERFEAAQTTMPSGYPFERFFRKFAKRRLSNAYRDRKRYERRRDPTVDWREEMERRAEEDDKPGFDFLLSHEEQIDPVRAAELREFREHLEEEVSHLNPLEKFLWREWWAGTPVRESARNAAISEAKAWRVRERLLAKMRVRLKNVGPDAHG